MMRPGDIDDKRRVRDKAFFRRRSDYDGLSIGETPDAAIRELRKPFGVAGLRAGAIRMVLDPLLYEPLEVVLDDGDHGAILGLPPFAEASEQIEIHRAEYLAEELAGIAELLPESEFAELLQHRPPASRSS
jgi:hypothetical protein